MSPVLVTDRARKDRSRTCRSMQNIRVSKSVRSLKNTSLAQRRALVPMRAESNLFGLSRMQPSERIANDERPVLCEAMEYCKANRIGILLVSELSRLGRNAFEVLASVKELIDCGINLYIQKEQLTLLDEEGHPSLFAPIMIATLSTCAQLERDNISFRLQSGRKQYIDKGGKLGRKAGSVKTEEQIRTEYRDVISLLRKGYSIRDVAKLSGKGVSTVQRVKRLIKVQSSQ